ncbi:carbohydrate ABC transporter permease [Psychromicrobium xiongbiense]|uniref:carbohydrate ABC transporter permease n=1 Tax=Psychromicrobium xiongbiense TaxID=3051184 RepID=UPI002552BA0B|nr:carbohydrate ABC transporter permease [Psychromicrobium sp. YIM S02556]
MTANSQVRRGQATRNHTRRKAGKAISQTVLWIITALFLVPFLYAILTALKPSGEELTVPLTVIGSSLQWDNFVKVFTEQPFGRYMLNSLIVAALGTVVVLIVSALAAFAFARLQFWARDKIFLGYLATMMIPGELFVVPLFLLAVQFHWVNSYQGLVLPFAFGAFGTFLLRQFFLTVPREIDDAARVDGAGTLRIFWSIMLPFARPTLSVLAVFTFLNYWNSFLWPLIITTDVKTMATVPLGLAFFTSDQGTQWNLVMAGSLVSMLPTALLAIAIQRNLTKGLLTSGLGGR